MRVALLVATTALTCGLTLAAGSAVAQSAPSGGAAGLRYLSWPGKAAAATAATSTPAPAVSASESGLRPAQPTHSAPQTYAAVAAPMSSTPTRRGLTPASDWLGQPQPPQTAAAVPGSPTPQPVSRTLPPPVPTPVPTVAQQAAVQPDYLPDVRPARHDGQAAMPSAQPQPAPLPPQPQPAPVQQRAALVQPSPVTAQRPAGSAPQATLVQAAPAQPSPVQAAPVQDAPGQDASVQDASVQAAATDAAFDPMAPRRDAPIFRMGQPAPAPTEGQVQTASVQPSPVQPLPASGSARYYSVHRQAGHQPDPTPLPQPTYLDGLPVELISPPQTADLAEPQSGPALIRNQNGTVRAVPASSEGDYQ